MLAIMHLSAWMKLRSAGGGATAYHRPRRRVSRFVHNALTKRTQRMQTRPLWFWDNALPGREPHRVRFFRSKSRAPGFPKARPARQSMAAEK